MALRQHGLKEHGKRLGLKSFDADANNRGRGSAGLRQQRVEIGIQRDDDAAFPLTTSQNLRVLCRAVADLADMYRINPCLAQDLCC